MKSCLLVYQHGTISTAEPSGGGNARTLPSEMVKVVVENWSYFPDVCAFGEEAEISEIFS